MDPHDKLMFNRYLDNATNYFEYGSGGSTYIACKKDNIKSVVTVESDAAWVNKLNAKIGKTDKLHIIYVDLMCQPGKFGHPGKECPIENKIQYSTTILQYNNIDLILIDGRFRVMCALNALSVITPSTFVLFDDFLNRPSYKIVLDYYDIVEQTEDNKMVVLVKKADAPIPTEKILDRYRTDAG